MTADWFRHVWLAWALYIGWCVLSVFVWFGVVEGIAIRNKMPGDTLTEVTRSLNLPMALWIIGGWLVVGLVLGFVIWWPVHLKLRW